MYSFSSRIRFSETDQDRNLTVTALLNYFQDCSCFQIEHAGVGFSFLDAQHLAWVVNYWQLDIKALPAFGDAVTVITNPYRYRNFMGFRNFALDDEKGQRLVTANSVWSLMNLEKLLPAMITPEHAECLGQETPFAMDYTDRKIAVPGEGGRRLSPVTVDESMLDSNRHVNNSQYVRIALAGMGEPGAPGRLRAEYKKQAFPGDVMHPVLYAGKDGSQIVSLEADDSSTYAVVSFETGLSSVGEEAACCRRE